MLRRGMDYVVLRRDCAVESQVGRPIRPIRKLGAAFGVAYVTDRGRIYDIIT
jgi:hypothetical protein